MHILFHAKVSYFKENAKLSIIFNPLQQKSMPFLPPFLKYSIKNKTTGY